MTTTIEQAKEEEKKQALPPATQASATPETAPAASQPQPKEATPSDPKPALKPEMSKGEKWYNRIVYTGVNYFLNLGISLFITDVFLHGKGKKLYHSGVDKFSGAFAKLGMKPANAKWVAEIAAGTFSLNSGGNILLIPTKIFEDNKRAIVYWLNEKFGVDQTAPDGHTLTPDEIYIEQEQPKQSWPRMIGRRVLGWLCTTATGMTIDKVLAKRTPSHHIDEIVVHTPGQEVFTEGTLKIADKVLKSGFVPGGEKIANNPTARRYMGYAALDWIYTIITSQVMKLTNGAGKMKAPHEIGDDAAPPAQQPIGESLKPGEHLELAAVADKPKRSAVDLARKNDKDAGADFATSTRLRSAEAAPLGMGA